MAKFIFGMNQSLDGYVDHDAFDPEPGLFGHFIEQTRRLTGSLYGRIMYETMRYWDDDQPSWSDAEREYAEAWRRQHKWVVSTQLKSVGPNATLIDDDLEGWARRIKSEQAGEIEVAGPQIARAIGDLGLIDEYQIYLHPAVVGSGKTYFAGPRPPLRLAAHERIVGSVLRLTYVPA